MSGSPGDRIARIAIAGRRWMSALHHGIDQRLILCAKCALERTQVFGPLLEGTRPRQHRSDEAVIEHPVERELPGAHPALLGMRLEFLCHDHGFLAKFSLQHALVLLSGARIRGRWLARYIFAREHAARERTVGHYAHAVVGAG